MTNGSLMKVERIGAFCNAFDLHEAIIGLEKHFSVFLRVAVLHRFYCTKLEVTNEIMSLFKTWKHISKSFMMLKR